MPWRNDTRPYYILVSELMLQQTQVQRVIPKFQEFIIKFPDEEKLAAANLSDVVAVWQGLGYNRRARYMQAAASMIMTDFRGTFPGDSEVLQRLPGVGHHTAGAIAAYAFNRPAIFVETNIRTVYIHHYFSETVDTVSDRQIIEVLERTLDRERPRQFYWSLMDYGSWLKQQGIRTTSRQHGYRPQTPFQGSVRQVRGAILRHLAKQHYSYRDLTISLGQESLDHQHSDAALRGLVRDGLIWQDDNGQFRLTD